MRYKTPRNLKKAATLIMEKGYDEDTAVSVAPKFFAMVKPGTPPVEHFIGLLEPLHLLRREDSPVGLSSYFFERKQEYDYQSYWR